MMVGEGWEAWKLAHAYHRIGSGTTPTSGNPEYYDDEKGTPWVTTSELREAYISSTSTNVTQTALEEFSTLRTYAPNSVFMAMYGATIGRLGISTVAATCNQACCVFEASDKFDNRFLYYWLWHRRSELISLSVGGGQPNLSQQDLRSERALCPPLETQERIAAFLDDKTAQIDALIARKQTLLARLAEKRQAIITKAVTKGLAADAALKDSGIDWLGPVPAHWEVKRLKYISPRVTVGIVVTPAAYYADEGTLALRGLNIKTMALDLSDTRNINDEGHALNRKSELREGDLVAVRTGAPGTTAIVPKELAGCNCIDLVIIRRSDNADSRYVGWFLNSDIAQTQYGMGSEGALQQHFNVETSKEVILTLPPIEEQREISTYIDGAILAHDRQRSMVEGSISKLIEYRAALISSAVNGEVERLR
jgi:type I restriction enzyme S subunit